MVHLTRQTKSVPIYQFYYFNWAQEQLPHQNLIRKIFKFRLDISKERKGGPKSKLVEEFFLLENGRKNTPQYMSKDAGRVVLTMSKVKLLLFLCKGFLYLKLDGVGPVDNRPSTDQLHHFVQQDKSTNSAKLPLLLNQ